MLLVDRSEHRLAVSAHPSNPPTTASWPLRLYPRGGSPSGQPRLAETIRWPAAAGDVWCVLPNH